jgi:hypothetical protein
MTLLAPLFFYVALGVAAGAVALHFIVTRQPASSPLPTVRFVPTSAVRVTTVAPVPEDLLLLLLRVLTVLVIGAALARPVLVPHRRPVARVVLADVSRSVGRIETVRDSARALLGVGDVLVAFDSSARVVRGGARDSAVRLTRTSRGGRLSSALIAALRAASTIRDEADSIELAIISPVRAGEIDGATQAIRALWPGRIRLVRIAAEPDSLAPPASAAVRADSDDPIALASSIAGVRSSDSRDATIVRVIRGEATPADSAWAVGGRRTLVRWPVVGAPPGWITRTAPDTVGAVIAGEAALVFPLERRWRVDTTMHASGGRSACRRRARGGEWMHPRCRDRRADTRRPRPASCVRAAGPRPRVTLPERRGRARRRQCIGRVTRRRGTARRARCRPAARERRCAAGTVATRRGDRSRVARASRAPRLRANVDRRRRG